MTAPLHKTLMIACGAMAKDIVSLKAALGLEDEAFALQCLPAIYHNYPEKIVPALKEILDEKSKGYDAILIGYGDCGTGGGLDRLLESYPKATRLPGAHCYEFFAGQEMFNGLMEEELGSFFLTDYLIRHFDTLIIKGMGLDRFPELCQTYFGHYKRVVYLSQTDDKGLISKAESAAKTLGLEFAHRPVGYGLLGTRLSTLTPRIAA